MEFAAPGGVRLDSVTGKVPRPRPFLHSFHGRQVLLAHRRSLILEFRTLVSGIWPPLASDYSRKFLNAI